MRPALPATRRDCSPVSIDEAAPRSRYGDAWAVVEPGLRWGEQSGLLERSEGSLRLTHRGRRLANEVFVRVVAPEVV